LFLWPLLFLLIILPLHPPLFYEEHTLLRRGQF
jgi:hypothetical protein